MSQDEQTPKIALELTHNQLYRIERALFGYWGELLRIEEKFSPATQELCNETKELIDLIRAKREE